MQTVNIQIHRKDEQNNLSKKTWWQLTTTLLASVVTLFWVMGLLVFYQPPASSQTLQLVNQTQPSQGESLEALSLLATPCAAQVNGNPTVYTGPQAVQDAVNVATSGNTIKIVGYCAGVQQQGGLTQTVFINKRLTLRGGYTTTNWNTSNPSLYPTTLDAEESGRVIRIGGGVDATIENLRVINGNDLSGGGIQATGVLTLRGVQVLSNTALSNGGGIYAPQLAMVDSTVRNNQSTGGSGGGVYIEGRLNAFNSVFQFNGSNSYGGGAYAQNVKTTRVKFIANFARIGGGGAYISGDSNTNSVVSSMFNANGSDTAGSALYLFDSAGSGGDIDIVHSTFASPVSVPASGREAIHIANGTVNISNTIIATHTVGILRTGGTANQAYNLFFGNNFDMQGGIGGGTGTIFDQDPLFVAPVLNDYRIWFGSAVIQLGNPAYLSSPNYNANFDLNGQPRAQDGANPDAGAYEFNLTNLGIRKTASPAVVAPGDMVAYTLVYSNNEAGQAFQGQIVDIIPSELTGVGYSSADLITVTGSIPYTWQLGTLLPGELHSITVNGQVNVTLPPSGIYVFTNTATIQGIEFDTNGSNNQSQASVTVVQPINGLNITNNSPTIQGNSTTFDAAITAGSSVGGPVVSYQLNFGDGSAIQTGPLGVSTPLNTNHNYLGPGIYIATITTTNEVSQQVATTTVTINTDLEIYKSVSPSVAAPGQSVIYTIVYTNVSGYTTSGITLTDIVPAQLINLSFISSGPSATPLGGTNYTWLIGDMAASQNGIITITGQVDPSLNADTTVINSAAIATGFEGTPGNNDDQAILNVVVPRIRIISTPYNAPENMGTLVIDTSLDAANPYADVTVTYNTADGSALAGQDYTASTGQLTIPAGQLSTSFSVPILDDTIDETLETFVASLSSPSGASLSSPSAVAVNIIDDDTADIIVNPVSLNISEPNGSAPFNIRLTSLPTGDVTIDLVVLSSQCTVLPATITLTSANWTTGVTATVTAFDDNIVDGSQPCNIQTSTASSSDNSYNNMAVDDVLAIVADDDTGDVMVVETDGNTAVAEGGASDTYTIILNSNPTDDVTITVTPDAQLDLGNGGGNAIVLTFNSSNWDTPQMVTVVAVDDLISENNHFGTITHMAISGDTVYNNTAIPNVTASITDNEVGNIEIAELDDSTDVTEGGASDLYQVNLNVQPMVDVTVQVLPQSQLDVGNGSGGAINLTFTPANWNVPQVVTVNAVDDNIVEGFHTATISHAMTSSDPNFGDVTASPLTVNITDNDFVDLQLTKSVNTPVTAPGQLISFTLTLTNNGNGIAANVVLTDIIPAVFSIQQIIPFGIIITDTGVTPGFVWQVQHLNPGQSGRIFIEAFVPSIATTTTVQNVARVFDTIPDNNPLDNTDGVNITIYPTLGADLVINKRATRVQAGHAISFVITIDNAGPAVADGAIISDPLPAGTTATWTCSAIGGATCSTPNGSGDINASIPQFPNGSQVIFTLVVQLADPDQIVVNVATVQTPEGLEDPNISNNSASATSSPSVVYLPITLKRYPFVQAPDLIVESLTVTTDTVTLVIRNIGDAPTGNSFWIDLYINPNTPPTQVNQDWWDLGNEGMTWGVTTAIPIGGSLTLTISDQYYTGGNFNMPISAGINVYAQVDSANSNTNYGAILETHEIFGTPYNNIIQTVSISSSSTSVYVGGIDVEYEAESLILTDKLPLREEK